MLESSKEIVKKIKSSKKILITSHIRPDGDNIGSILGLYHSLDAAGCDVTTANFDPVPPAFMFLPGADRIKKLSDITEKFDLLIVLDSSSVDRTGLTDLSIYSDFMINIDHHVCNYFFGNLNLVASDYSSTAQIVYDLLKAGRLPMSDDVAICLFTGLFTDTGCFQNSSTNEKVFRMAADLAAKGANSNLVSREIFQNRSMTSVMISGKVLSSLNFLLDGKICWGKVDAATFHQFGGTYEDVMGIVNQMLSIRGVEVSILFSEQFNKVLLDWRSKSVIDVNRVAVHFGGGGHLKASGATIPGTLETVVPQVIDFTVEYIKSNYLTKNGKGGVEIEQRGNGNCKRQCKKTGPVRKSVGI